jgi:hypothetical protein
MNSLYLALAALGLTLFILTFFSLQSRKFGTDVAERWARDKGMEVVSIRRRTFVPQWPWLFSRRFQFFRVVLRDANGANRKACLRLESDCTQPQIIDVVWDANTPP